MAEWLVAWWNWQGWGVGPLSMLSEHDFQLKFTNGKKTVITGSWHYVCLLKGLGHFNNANHVHGSMEMAVEASNAIKHSKEPCTHFTLISIQRLSIFNSERKGFKTHWNAYERLSFKYDLQLPLDMEKDRRCYL